MKADYVLIEPIIENQEINIRHIGEDEQSFQAIFCKNLADLEREFYAFLTKKT